MKAPYQFSSAPSCLIYVASIMATFRSNNITILFWTVRRIRNKRVEFLTCLSANNILLAPVAEPHLKLSTKLTCPNYFVNSNDRDDTPGGGTAIVVRKVIKQSEILLPILQHTESRKSVIPVVCVKLGKLYVVKHNCVT